MRGRDLERRVTRVSFLVNATIHMFHTLRVFLCSCGSGAFQFSQLPEFKEYFINYPPRETELTPDERSLLHRFRPRFFLADEQEPFIDFYKDYIAHGYLMDEHGKIISLRTYGPYRANCNLKPGMVR